jgi:hypothetical protein
MARPSDAEIAVLLREQRRVVDLGDLAREDERLFVERFRASLLRRLHADDETPSLWSSGPEVVSRFRRTLPADRGAA